MNEPRDRDEGKRRDQVVKTLMEASVKIVTIGDVSYLFDGSGNLPYGANPRNEWVRLE